MNSAQSTEINIQSMAGKLPYNHLVFKGEDPRTTLVGISFQILTVLLDFQSGTARDKVFGSGEGQASAPTTDTNAFRYFLAKLVSGVIIIPDKKSLYKLLLAPHTGFCVCY